jgi:hypothetical protein
MSVNNNVVDMAVKLWDVSTERGEWISWSLAIALARAAVDFAEMKAGE